MTLNTRIFIGVLASFLALGSVCTRSKRPRAALPADFYLSFGEGGGITGDWRGYSITATGTLYQWETSGRFRDSVMVRILDRGEQVRLLTELDRIAFFDQRVNEPANMSVSILATRAGRTNRTLFPRTNRSSAVPQAMLTLHAFCKTLAAK